MSMHLAGWARVHPPPVSAAVHLTVRVSSGTGTHPPVPLSLCPFCLSPAHGAEAGGAGDGLSCGRTDRRTHGHWYGWMHGWLDVDTWMGHRQLDSYMDRQTHGQVLSSPKHRQMHGVGDTQSHLYPWTHGHLSHLHMDGWTHGHLLPPPRRHILPQRPHSQPTCPSVPALCVHPSLFPHEHATLCVSNPVSNPGALEGGWWGGLRPDPSSRHTDRRTHGLGGR